MRVGCMRTSKIAGEEETEPESVADDGDVGVVAAGLVAAVCAHSLRVGYG